jgi:hypothetical protein
MSNSAKGTMCVVNLGPRQRRIRRIFGVVGLLVAVAAAGALFAFDAPRWSRVALVLPLWISALGFFQAREKT